MKDQKLVYKYRVLDRDIALFSDKLDGLGTCEETLFIPTKANQTLMQANLDMLKKRLCGLEAPDGVFQIMKSHFKDYLEGVQLSLSNIYNAPSSRLIRYEGRSITSIFRKDTRPDTYRKDLLISRMQQYDAYFAAIFEWVEDLPASELQQMLSRLYHMQETVTIEREDAGQFMPALDKTALDELTQKMAEFSEDCLGKWIQKLEGIIAAKGAVPSAAPRGDADSIPVDHDAYRKALAAQGVDLDDMLGWFESEVEKTRADALEIANNLDIPEKGAIKTMGDVNDVLFKYAGPCDSPEEMYRRADEYTLRGRAAAQEYVWLPPDELCICEVMMKQTKKTNPWGGYGGGSPYSRPLRCSFYLNDENYTAITDGWIKINAIHEAYPGHHVQFVRALYDPLPETIKRGAKETAITEATCIRTEKAFEWVFAEDPFYPLFSAYRRHHTSVRIMVDIWLRYYGKTINDVVELYMRELGFDRHTARTQVQAHENDLGYFTTYYYGYKKISEWEAYYGFNKKEYTELLFSACRISLENFQRFLELSEEDKYSYLHDFPSLLQFK